MPAGTASTCRTAQQGRELLHALCSHAVLVPLLQPVVAVDMAARQTSPLCKPGGSNRSEWQEQVAAMTTAAAYYGAAGRAVASMCAAPDAWHMQQAGFSYMQVLQASRHPLLDWPRRCLGHGSAGSSSRGCCDLGCLQQQAVLARSAHMRHVHLPCCQLPAGLHLLLTMSTRWVRIFAVMVMMCIRRFCREHLPHHLPGATAKSGAVCNGYVQALCAVAVPVACI